MQIKMLDVLFIEPNSSRSSYQGLADDYAAIETPTWSLLLAQSCRAKGFKPAILDANAERLSDEQALERVKQLNPRLVCFVVYGQNPNSGTVNMSGVISLSKLLHDSGYKISVVGSHASAKPKELMEYPSIDIVLTNEGVYAMHNLLASDLSDEALREIKGIGFNGVLNPPERIVPQDRMVEDLPGYAWDLLPYKEKPFDLYRAHFWHAGYKHEDRSPFAAIYTSFGCKFKCQFCMINILNRTDNRDDAVSSDFNVMRYWPADFIIKEFDKLHEYGVKNIRISDEMFFLQKKHYEPILTLLEERNYPLNMWAYSRIDTCRPEFLERFKKVGINWLGLGIEAATKVVRQEVTKGSFRDIDIQTVVKNIKDAGINVGANYIFGFPGENMQNLQETLDLAKEINAEFSNVYCAAALPGSPLHLEAVKNNWPLPETFSEYGFYSYDCKPLPTRHLTPKQVLKFRDDAWTELATDERYLQLVESKFGKQARANIEEQAKLKLRRKLLEEDDE